MLKLAVPSERVSDNVSRLAARRAETSSARPLSRLHDPHQLPTGRGGFSGARKASGGANRLLSAGPYQLSAFLYRGVRVPSDTAQEPAAKIRAFELAPHTKERNQFRTSGVAASNARVRTTNSNVNQSRPRCNLTFDAASL